MTSKLSHAIIFLLMWFSFGCNTKPSNTPLEIELGIYERSLKASDPNTALGAAHRIVLLSPENHKSYYDSIAQLYFEMGNFMGAKLVALSAMKDHSNKLIVEILAYSSLELGQYEDASTFLQKMMKIDSANDVVYLYELGSCYYQMRNNETAFNYMKQVTMHEQSRMMKKRFVTDGKPDETYYYVAALNTMGVIFMENGKLDRATEILEEVSNIDGKFKLGANNLNLVKKLANSAKEE